MMPVLAVAVTRFLLVVNGGGRLPVPDAPNWPLWATKPSGAVSLGSGAQIPRKKVRWCFSSSALAVHNSSMAPEYNFKLALTRKIEPTAGPGVELATLADAARFVALMKPFRQARAHWDFAAEL